VIRVLSDARPDADFQPTEPALEDVYFAAMRQGREASRATAGASPTLAADTARPATV
jgi:hypothetical protein